MSRSKLGDILTKRYKWLSEHINIIKIRPKESIKPTLIENTPTLSVKKIFERLLDKICTKISEGLHGVDLRLQSLTAIWSV